MKKKFKNPTTSVTKIPKNPIRAFGLGVMEGKKYIYSWVLEPKPPSKIALTRILTFRDMIDALNKIKNNDISKMDYFDAFDLGDYFGRKIGVEFVLKNNFDRELIQNEWFNLANKIENFE